MYDLCCGTPSSWTEGIFQSWNHLASYFGKKKGGKDERDQITCLTKTTDILVNCADVGVALHTKFAHEPSRKLVVRLIRFLRATALLVVSIIRTSDWESHSTARHSTDVGLQQSNHSKACPPETKESQDDNKRQRDALPLQEASFHKLCELESLYSDPKYERRAPVAREGIILRSSHLGRRQFIKKKPEWDQGFHEPL